VSVELRTHANAQSAAEACGAYILERLAEAVATNGTASLAISGGSSPKLMFDSMARAEFDWSHVHLFWVDERPVPPDHEQSNFRLANQHLIAPAKILNVHRIAAELPPDHAASRYVHEVRDYFRMQDRMMPNFDVIHLGIGADAHTASLFPGEPLIEDRDGIAAAVYVHAMRQWRITLLPGVILAARHVCVLTAGADKHDALKHILHDAYAPLEYPAQILTTRTPAPLFFVDEASVS
jgi:6-phosphogluconolactonase